MPSERQRVEYEPVRPAGRGGLWREDGGEGVRPSREPNGGGLSGRLPGRDGGETLRPPKPPSERPNPETTAAGEPTDDAPAVAASAAAPRRGRDGATAGEVWSVKRGHSLTYAGLFLFTFTLFFRPYEFLPLPTSLAFVVGACVLAVYVPSQIALEGTLTARPREVTLAFLLVLAAALSIPLATNRAEAVDAFTEPFLKAVVIFVVFVNVVRTERRWRWLMWLTLGVSFYLSAGALNDYRHGRFAVEGYRVGGRIGGMFSGANELGLHLVTVLPVAVGMLWAGRGLPRKLLYGGLSLMMAAAIVVTFSRGAFLGLMAAGAVLMWKLGRRHRFGVFALVVVAALSLVALAPGEYGTRVLSIFDSSLDPNASSSMRRDVFWRSLNVIAHNPVFGVGIGNFHIMSIRDLVSHNAYTQVASEMGLAALVVYVLFIVTPLRRLRQIERETYDSRRGSRFYYRAVALQASLAGYMVSSFFASVAYQWYIYYLVAYAVTLRRLYAAEVQAAEVQAAEMQAAEAAAAAADDAGPDALPGAARRPGVRA